MVKEISQLLFSFGIHSSAILVIHIGMYHCEQSGYETQIVEFDTKTLNNSQSVNEKKISINSKMKLGALTDENIKGVCTLLHIVLMVIILWGSLRCILLTLKLQQI